MGLGLGIVLIVLGLIFVTGVINYDINFIEDTTLGWILLAAGVLALVLGLVMNQQRSRTKHVEERRVDPV
jgi:cell division protein FtsW (lipid II flippase)